MNKYRSFLAEANRRHMSVRSNELREQQAGETTWKSRASYNLKFKFLLVLIDLLSNGFLVNFTLSVQNSDLKQNNQERASDMTKSTTGWISYSTHFKHHDDDCFWAFFVRISDSVSNGHLYKQSS